MLSSMQQNFVVSHSQKEKKNLLESLPSSLNFSTMLLAIAYIFIDTTLLGLIVA